MEVTVTIHGRETFTLTVEPTILVEEFKSIVHIKADVPVFAQQLSAPQRNLNIDRQPLSSTGLQAGDHVTVYCVPERNMPNRYVVMTLQQTFVIEARRYDIVRQVKELLRQQGCGDIRLHYKGEDLEDQHTLAYYQVESELLALTTDEFPLSIESACKSHFQLVVNSACTVASLLPRALEKCRTRHEDVSLVHNTRPLTDGTLLEQGITSATSLYLDQPYEVYLTSSAVNYHQVTAHYFDTTSVLKQKFADAHPQLGPADTVRLFWQMRELLPEERIGKVLPYEHSAVHVVFPQEILICVSLEFHSDIYVAIDPSETPNDLLNRQELKSLGLHQLVRTQQPLDPCKSLSLNGVQMGDILQGTAYYKVNMLDDRQITCEIQLPAIIRALKHAIKASEGIPLKKQTLYQNPNSKTLQEITSEDSIGTPHTTYLLLLPGEIVLRVKNSDESEFTVAAALSDSVAQLKVRIEKVNKVPPTLQRLYFQDQPLEDDALLSHYHLTDKQTLSFFADNETLLKVRDSAGKVVDYLVRGNLKIKDIKQDMWNCRKFWFDYQRYSNLRLYAGDRELKTKMQFSKCGLVQMQEITVKVEKERLVTIHTCHRPSVVRLFTAETTIRRLKETVSDHYVPSNLRRFDRLYFNREVVDETDTLGSLPAQCEVEYLDQDEKYLIYMRETDGLITRVGVCEFDVSILALKQKWSQQRPFRPTSVKILHKGRVLKDAEDVHFEPWTLMDVVTWKDWLIWVKPGTGPSFQLGVRPTDTVAGLKQAIRRVFPCSESMTLVANSVVLQDASVISSTSLRRGGTVLLRTQRSVLVFVQSLFGPRAAFILPSQATVAALKILIERKLTYRRKCQVLTYNNQEISDKRSVRSFHCADYVSVFLSLKR